LDFLAVLVVQMLVGKEGAGSIRRNGKYDV
jgi:hypothetical protein